MTKRQLKKIQRIRRTILTHLDKTRWKWNGGLSTLLDCVDDILGRNNAGV